MTGADFRRITPPSLGDPAGPQRSPRPALRKPHAAAAMAVVATVLFWRLPRFTPTTTLPFPALLGSLLLDLAGVRAVFGLAALAAAAAWGLRRAGRGDR